MYITKQTNRRKHKQNIKTNKTDKKHEQTNKKHKITKDKKTSYFNDKSNTNKVYIF